MIDRLKGDHNDKDVLASTYPNQKICELCRFSPFLKYIEIRILLLNTICYSLKSFFRDSTMNIRPTRAAKASSVNLVKYLKR